jgi:hypothetical protein
MAKLHHTPFASDQIGQWQPKRKNQWYVELQPPAGNALESIMVKSAGLPGGSFTEIAIDYMNSKYYFPGKWEWETIQMTLRDFVGNSATQKLYDWFLHIYNPETGGQNMGGEIKRNVSIKLLDPRGNLVETWTLVGAWPSAMNWGEGGLAYDDDGERELSVTFRFDYAVLASEDSPNTGFNINLDEDETNEPN